MMKKFNYWKWGVITAALVAWSFYMRSCGIKSVKCSTGITQIVTPAQDSNVHVPVPVKVDSGSKENIKPAKVKKSSNEEPVLTPDDLIKTSPDENTFNGSIGDQVWIPADTTNHCNDIAYYSDTTKLKNATVVIDDTLAGNRITGRKVQAFTHDTNTIKTVVLTQPKRPIFYFGVSAMGNKYNLLYGIGPHITYKAPTDKLYSAGTKYIVGGHWVIEGRLDWPIRLGKRN